MPRAPRRCPGDDYTCDQMVSPGRQHCAQHERAWADTERTASSRLTSTAAWRKLAKRILKRDKHQCQIRYEDICIGHATTVDHKIPVGQRPDLALDPANCRAACRPCNEHKGRTEDKRLLTDRGRVS